MPHSERGRGRGKKARRRRGADEEGGERAKGRLKFEIEARRCIPVACSPRSRAAAPSQTSPIAPSHSVVSLRTEAQRPRGAEGAKRQRNSTHSKFSTRKRAGSTGGSIEARGRRRRVCFETRIAAPRSPATRTGTACNRAWSENADRTTPSRARICKGAHREGGRGRRKRQLFRHRRRSFSLAPLAPSSIQSSVPERRVPLLLRTQQAREPRGRGRLERLRERESASNGGTKRKATPEVEPIFKNAARSARSAPWERRSLRSMRFASRAP